ncbi:MAG: acyl-CoA thioesterase [Paludibacteraceae bacterium]|nr:acyl-CoA thioesterase [Paludibacteraceae bacterium]
MKRNSSRLSVDYSGEPLTSRIEVKVRFSEVDSIRVVWHGSYVKYMEDGREDFGEKYGLEYMTIFNNGYTAPMVDMNLRYLQSVTVGDTVIVETRYVPTKAAKIIFEYSIFRKSDNALVLTATTTQVFMSKSEGILELNNPPFYEEWKKRWGVE